VFFHTYTYVEGTTGDTRVVLLVNASRERLWLSNTTMEIERWLRGDVEGDPPSLTSTCPETFNFERTAARLEAMHHILTEDVWVETPGQEGRKHLLSVDLVEKCICLHDNTENGVIVFGGRHRDSWAQLLLRGGGLTPEQITDMHNHFGDETGACQATKRASRRPSQSLATPVLEPCTDREETW
jgi:hypothetical protein